MYYPTIKQPNPEDLQRQREIQNDHRKLAEAELQRIFTDLHMTTEEVQIFGPYIQDFRSGRTGSDQLRGNLTLALENHRDHLINRKYLPDFTRCAKCNRLHMSNDECAKAYEPPPRRKPQQMTRAQAFAELHLAENAPPELIRSAYLRLARIHHPDNNGGDGERMRRINEAYSLLGGKQ